MRHVHRSAPVSASPELAPCPGCGALFPPDDGPTHRYLGASTGCWALFNWASVHADVTDLTARSRIPERDVAVPAHNDAPATRSQYVLSVYETWMALHRGTVEQWWERYVAPD